MLPKRLRKSSAPLTPLTSTEPLLSFTKLSPFASRSSMLPKELFSFDGAGLRDGQRAVAVVDVGAAAHAGRGDAAEAVFDGERSV